MSDPILLRRDEGGVAWLTLNRPDARNALSAALMTALETALAEVERILAVVQSFDPTGIAARSLSECLALEAKEADRYDPAMARLLDNLDYLAKGNFSALQRICSVDDEDLGDMVRELRAYDPKPGCRFAGGFHGLTLGSVGPVAALPQIRELNIGHSLIADAIFVGLEQAVRDMRSAMDRARRP